MTGPKRTRALARTPARRAHVVAWALVVALALAVAAAPAAAKSDAKEDQTTYQQQLAANQIASATINKRIGRVHLTLKDGKRVFFHYGKGDRPKVEEELKAKRVAFTVLKPAAAQREEKAQPKKHKIRYIVGGVLVAIVVIVGIVLLVRRRRAALAE